MIILKAIILQVFWFLCVYSSSFEYSHFMWAISFVLLVSNNIVFKRVNELIKDFIFALLFSLIGLIQDNILISSNSISLENVPLWLNALWPVFVLYYSDIFLKFKDLNFFILGFIGAIGGSFAYYSGCNLAGIEITNSLNFFLIISLVWFFFFPVSLKMYHNVKLLDSLIDKTIYFSFDKSGYLRHEKYFKHDYKNLTQENVLVTGGTSGIGKAVVEHLKLNGINTFFTGRNASRAKDLVSKKSHFVPLDMARWDFIDKSIEPLPKLDAVVLNAGAMPEQHTLNENGIELQAASQLIGHYKLILKLNERGLLNDGCRIIWVSSGGMYLKKLDVSSLTKSLPYDKVATYANVKRAQITLVEEMAKSTEWNKFSIVSMHPGWVATNGLKEALTGFTKFTGKRLRTPEQGADTINWLVRTTENIQSGKFYFDRKIVSPYIHKSFIPSTKQRQQLLDFVNDSFTKTS